MQTAQRLKKLGTETAYAVAEEAAKHAKEGNKVYALHIGDINIPTPVSTSCKVSSQKKNRMHDSTEFDSRHILFMFHHFAF